jgi:hypothetical protein
MILEATSRVFESSANLSANVSHKNPGNQSSRRELDFSAPPIRKSQFSPRSPLRTITGGAQPPDSMIA